MPELLTTTTSRFCPHCGQQVLDSDLFCSHCGYQLIDTLPSTGRVIFIYAVSLALPPFGLIYFFRYIKSSDASMKRIGIISLAITILSTILALWFAFIIFQQAQNSLNTYSNLGI